MTRLQAPPKGKHAAVVSGTRINKTAKSGVELSLDRLTAVESQLEQLSVQQKQSQREKSARNGNTVEEEEALAGVARAIIGGEWWILKRVFF